VRSQLEVGRLARRHERADPYSASPRRAAPERASWNMSTGCGASDRPVAVASARPPAGRNGRHAIELVCRVEPMSCPRVPLTRARPRRCVTVRSKLLRRPSAKVKVAVNCWVRHARRDRGRHHFVRQRLIATLARLTDPASAASVRQSRPSSIAVAVPTTRRRRTATRP